MFSNYVSVALRNLVKNKLYSAINIIGLAIGLAACILITLFVRDELSYDQFWTKADRLYRLNTTFSIPGREPFVTVVSPGPSKGALERFFAQEIDKVVRLQSLTPVIEIGNALYTDEMIFADPTASDVLDFDVVAGDMKAVLTDNASIALSEKMAHKYFGDQPAVGKVMTITNYNLKRDYRVAAVFRDLPHNTVLAIEMVAMIDENDWHDQAFLFDSWFSVNNTVLFTLKPGVDISSVTSRFDAFADNSIEMPAELTGGKGASAFVQFGTTKLVDAQLHPAGLGEMKPTGNIATVIIFASIAGLILVIACINFMNLATAKSTQRAREVALRKVLGAGRGQLIVQFIGESVLIALIGLVAGIVIVEAALPFYGEFIGRDLSFDYTDGMTLAILAGLVATVGVVGGVYPAIILSGFRPAWVLKANKSAETSGSAALRSGLVIFQFAVSIALIVGTSGVYGQLKYATTMDPGYTKDNMFVLHRINRKGAEERRDALKAEIQRLPGVVSATFSGDTPGSSDENNTSVEIPGQENTGTILIGVQDVDHDFFKTYQIPIIAGRDYDRQYAGDSEPSVEGLKEGDVVNSNIIVNESVLNRLGFGTPEEALGKVFMIGRGNGVKNALTIVGVVPDVHFQSLKTVKRPEMYALDADNYGNLTVRFTGDPKALVSGVENIWRSLVTGVPISYEFVDEALAEEFDQEEATATMLALFAGLAVFVACLGLYGLAAFTAERRTKEIGIRKVMGATVTDIVRLLLWQFSKPVIIANLIAWPVAVWGMLSWLENFPYRMEAWVLGPLCLIAGLIALGIAWATVGGNAAQVARANPIKALRYE
ncbi:ABC transporter permease [Pseudokordiimonas caeni]|uniref:ABC transporter permease n=1 Tax=Pseudokordiimonas caeni TaxID=2997908 RepID=UPI00281118CD|nr:ABC transporter permease [Pseudokordiimonas caeni]